MSAPKASDRAVLAKQERVSIYVQPGQIAVSAEPAVITTILGSCVAVCVWDPTSSAGGMNHFLLPFWAGGGVPSSARFGNVAVQDLVKKLDAFGCVRESLRAKVFGGACVLDGFKKRAGEHLGDKNVRVAFEELAQIGIPVIAEDTGGDASRKLHFYTDLGTVAVQRI